MIAVVDVSDDLRAALGRSELTALECASVHGVAGALARQGEQVEALVLGAAVHDPVQGAAQAYLFDPALSVVILGADAAQCARIQAALRFAPLIGRDVACCEAGGGRALAAIEEAAARTRARRSHRRTLRSLQAKLEPPSGQPPPLRERYAAHLMELAPIGIVGTDRERRVVSANAEAARILGKSEREMLGRSLGVDLLGEDAHPWSDLLSAATAEPSATTTIVQSAARGSTTLEARAVTIHDASGGGYVVVFQDVTQRVALEQQKQEALARAETASRLKDEFLATVSHELRTPLNAILGWARLLRTQLSEAKRERALETIERNALVQSQLIEDLLDITRITAGKLRLEVQHVPLIPVIEAAIETVRPSLEAKQIRLTPTLDTRAGPVSGDPQRLQQVVWNLLSNAVKFSPKLTGHIRILLERVESHIEITVADNGQGIAPEFVPYAFESFRQADGSASRRHGGLGLGLAITKHLVELHGGSIHAYSEGLGKGAIFTVCLPLSPIFGARSDRITPIEHLDPHVALDPPPELFQLRVLVLDDEEDGRDLVVDVLASCGAIVESAGSVAQALELVDSFRPSVILSDIGMPGEDGYSFISKLRARPRERGGATPVAALTAYARAEDRRRALHAGFQMHVVKPVEPSELLVVVATLARMAKLVQ